MNTLDRIVFDSITQVCLKANRTLHVKGAAMSNDGVTLLLEVMRNVPELKLVGFNKYNVQRPLKPHSGNPISIRKYYDMLGVYVPSHGVVKDLKLYLIGQGDEIKALGEIIEKVPFDGIAKETEAAKVEEELVPAKDFLDQCGLDLFLDVAIPDDTKKFFLATKKGRVKMEVVSSFFSPSKIPQKVWSQLATTCYRVYFPNLPSGVIRDAAIEAASMYSSRSVPFNSYIPPMWKDGKYSYVKPKLFVDLVEHLFPRAEEREYLCTWIWTSLTTRCHVYLVLCGRGGIGKSILSGVLQGLHGESNYVTGKKDSLKRFNSQILNSTLCWFDELRYTLDDENTLKEWQNNKIAIEKKFQDTTQATRIFASMAISNNNPRDNYLPFDARKFAPLVLTKKRLEESMKAEDIDLLSKKCDQGNPEYDPQFLFSIFKYCEKNAAPKKFPNMEYKGPMFYYLTNTSMSRWQVASVSIVLSAHARRRGRIPKKEKYDPDLGYNWNNILEDAYSELAGRKQINKVSQGDFPENSTVMNFFNIFTDRVGDICFKAQPISGDITNNFHVMPIKDVDLGELQNGEP